MSDLISRDFKGIWISRDIWLSKELSLHAKCLWAEIDSLFNKDQGGCYASDEYLEEFLNVKRSRLHEIFKELTDKGYLEKVSFDGRRVIRKAIMPDFDRGQQVSGIPDSRVPENRTPNIRDSGSLTYIENKEKIKEQQQQQQGFVVVPQESGDFVKSDLYFACEKLKKDWSSEEMESAFKIYKLAKSPISEPLKYIEGIINKKRLLNTNKEKTCQKNEKPQLKSSSVIGKQPSLESDTGERPLAKLVSQLQMKQKSSNS